MRCHVFAVWITFDGFLIIVSFRSRILSVLEVTHPLLGQALLHGQYCSSYTVELPKREYFILLCASRFDI